jgi:transmembrane sensor
MKNLPDHITENELAKYFAGEADPALSLIIETWAKADDSSFYQYKMIWEDLGVLQNSSSSNTTINVDAAWKSVKLKKQKQAKSVFPYIMKIAASLLLVGSLAWYFSDSFFAEQILIANSSENTLELQLSDASLVTLNENSQFEYPENFRDETRQVILTGEAFFKITEDPSKPFIIQVGEATVTVLGTSFNIRANEKMDTITVFVESGKVRFAFGKKELILTTGEKGVLYTNESILEIAPRETIGMDQFWRTKRLRFSGEKLTDVVNILSAAYGQKIKLKNDNLKTCSINAKFESDSLKDVLEIIALTLDLKMETIDATIYLDGRGCENQ